MEDSKDGKEDEEEEMEDVRGKLFVRSTKN